MLAGCLSQRKMTQTFGNNALLLAPLVSSRSMRIFMANRFKFLATQDQQVDTQQITVARAAPDFAALVGAFKGHTRTLRVSKDGLVTETQFSGCCQKLVVLTYQLSEPRTTGKGDKAVTTAQAVLTKVVYDKKAMTTQAAEAREDRHHHGEERRGDHPVRGDDLLRPGGCQEGQVRSLRPASRAARPGSSAVVRSACVRRR